jgi:integrase
MREVVKVPSPGEPDHGIALDQDELKKLLEGFRGLSLFPIVAVAAFTGARRGEILALRWDDFDVDAKNLRIERSVDDTDKHGLRIKGPKTERGKRTITIDDDLVSLLVSERDRYLRIVAGVPDGVSVDLSLVKLPAGALIFPSPVDDLAKPRHPRAVTKEFAQRVGTLGFAKLRFHDLRGTHETMLLDRGVPAHVVAARCGHDPAVMLRSRKADVSAAAVIGAIAKGILT